MYAFSVKKNKKQDFFYKKITLGKCLYRFYSHSGWRWRRRCQLLRSSVRRRKNPCPTSRCIFPAFKRANTPILKSPKHALATQ
jgi:hypothetical protein